MTESTIRVVLVDDDAMVRSALRMFLGGDQGIAIVGEAGDGAHALAVVREHRPDVVLMDIRMPLVDGLAATEAIMGWPQPPRIIVLTTFDTDEDVLHALRSGAAGFLSQYDKARAALEQLCDRELEVAQAVARGLSNAEISGELYLSVATVKTHIGRILSKLGLDNRVQIALAVRDADLPS